VRAAHGQGPGNGHALQFSPGEFSGAAIQQRTVQFDGLEHLHQIRL
jgi:hypothetical protein